MITMTSPDQCAGAVWGLANCRGWNKSCHLCGSAAELQTQVFSNKPLEGFSPDLLLRGVCGQQVEVAVVPSQTRVRDIMNIMMARKLSLNELAGCSQIRGLHR